MEKNHVLLRLTLFKIDYIHYHDTTRKCDSHTVLFVQLFVLIVLKVLQ